MSSGSPWLEKLGETVSSAAPRMQKLQVIAALIRNSGNYRWVGLYEIDERAGEVINLVWDGPDAPAYPRFPIGKGLTGAAIQERKVINVGDVRHRFMVNIDGVTRQSPARRYAVHGCRPHVGLASEATLHGAILLWQIAARSPG
jgi:hypothetical protein